jgi:hypothetical protein
MQVHFNLASYLHMRITLLALFWNQVVSIRKFKLSPQSYTAPVVDTASSIPASSGITFDGNSFSYSGEQSVILASKIKAQSTSPFDTSDDNYGMVQAEFEAPGTSNTDGLSKYIPADITIAGCAPSSDANRADCKKGTANYNLYMLNPQAAK